MRNSYVRKFQFTTAPQSGGKAQPKKIKGDAQDLSFPEYYLLFSGILKLAEGSEEFRVRNKVSQIFRRAILLWVNNEFRHSDGMTTLWLNSIYWSLLEQIKKQLDERVDNQSDRSDGEQYMLAMENILALSIKDNAYIGIVSILSNFGQGGMNISHENLLKWIPPQEPMTDEELSKYLGDIQEKGSNLPLAMISKVHAKSSAKSITKKLALKMCGAFIPRY